MWQAATRLHDEMPSDKEIATAKYWAAEGGSRIGHAALHIHGGISIDVDYPIHRYFLWAEADRVHPRRGDAAAGAARRTDRGSALSGDVCCT